MASAQQGRHWATAEDWVAARPIITKLYKDDMKPLKEVMATMKKEHSFYATPRMYKARLKEWDISKNLKATEALAIYRIMEERKAAGESFQVILRGRPVDVDKMRENIRRTLNRSKLARFDMIQRRTEGPRPGPAAPVPLRPAEDLLRSIRVFTDGAFLSGKWFLAPDGVVRSRKGERGRYTLLDLWDRMDVASQLMAKSEKVDLVRMLNPVFGYLVDIVREECPRSLPYLLSCFEVLYTRNRRDIIDMFINYIRSLSAKMLGDDHPQTRIWKNALAVFSMEHEEILERAFFLLMDDFRERTQQSGPSISAYNDYHDAILSHKALETQERSLRRQIDAIIPGGEKREAACLLRYRHAMVVKDLSLQHGRFAEAETALDCLRDYGDWDSALALQTRADVRMRMGDLAAAEKFYREASKLVDNKSMYRDEGWINGIFENLETILSQTGQHSEAKKFRQVRLSRIESLASQKIEEEVAEQFASVHGDPRSLVAETPVDADTPDSNAALSASA